jgi:hypothetical protein
MYKKGNEIHFDIEDQCNTCKHNISSACPYLQALYYNVVDLVEETNVTHCELYLENITHLRRIK